jgi:hypothetical protein
LAEILVFLSPETESTYRERIFEVLALPENSTVRFAYPLECVPEGIHTEGKQLKGKEGIVFFAPETRTESKCNISEKGLHSVRRVKIKKMESNRKTGFVAFTLELHEFWDAEMRELGEGMLVGKLGKDMGKCTKWLERVQSISEYFTQHVFFSYDIFTRRGTRLKPVYCGGGQDAVFRLIGEHSYTLKLTYWDREKGKSIITIDGDEAISIHPKKLVTFGKLTGDASLVVATGPARKAIIPSSLCVRTSDSPIGVSSQILVQKTALRMVIFGGLVMLGFGAILMAQAVGKALESGGLSYYLGELAVTGLFMAGISGALLYGLFDKK